MKAANRLSFLSYRGIFSLLNIVAATLIVVCLTCSFPRQANSQGGWKTWNIHLKDGQTLFASPLISADEKHVIYNVGTDYQHENSISGYLFTERWKIDYIAIDQKLLLPNEIPSGFPDKDLIILKDGQNLSGKIDRIYSKNLGGAIVVFDGKEIEAKEIAVIKFATKPATIGKAKIAARFRDTTIDSVLQIIRDNYAYPEIAKQIEENIRARQKSGEYDSITDGNELAVKINADLRNISGGNYLKLAYSPKPLSINFGKPKLPSPEEAELMRREQTRGNFGLQKVEILKGNIGLLQIDYFADLDWSGDTYAAAMNLLAETEALIIDVRKNSETYDPNAISFFFSYLFEKPVRISDLISRDPDEERQLWTSAKVPGRKYLGKPVYVLTSRHTAFGAEAFADYLFKLSRATIIGETTAGTNIRLMLHRVNEHFSLRISIGRLSGDSEEKENFAMQPHVELAAEKAFNEAYLQALRQTLRDDLDEAWKAELKFIISTLSKQ